MDLASGAQPVEPKQHGSLRAVQSMSRLPATRKEAELRKTKSIRARPTDLMNGLEAVPRLPLKDPNQPRELPHRSSKLSLFHLFSKPKVEKLRGYTEPEARHITPPTAVESRPMGGQEADLGIRRQGTAGDTSSARPGSSKSQFVVRSTTKLTPRERVPTLPQQRKSTPFSPPPLFQAYPQATKHGVLEIPAVSPDSTQKSKSNRSGSLQVSSVETVRKIFVLITSGYLLQYAYDGPSDRHPEKILELGEESAAFACDLVPGQHFVLQVSHAVSRHGIIATNSTSFLTRLGLRGNTSRRMISNCWLVLTTAEEMDSWMLAIRQEIEILGGSRAREHLVAALSATGDQVKTSPEKAPSTSHRYQVKRDPSKVLSVASPTDQVAFSGPPTPSVKVDDDSVDTATIDDIEIEASAIGSAKQTTRARATSDAPSVSSSTAQSVEQQQLEKIRNSIRISHTSSRTTGLTSRTNSPTSSYLCDGPSKSGFEPISDATASAVMHRAQPSFTSGSRRSLLPLLLSKDAPLNEGRESNASITQDAPTTHPESPIRSPTVGAFPASTEALQSPQTRLSMAQGVPNLKASAGTKKRHDSKVQSPRASSHGDRPESVLGELPSPSAWNSKTSPNPRNSTLLLASGTEALSGHSFRRTGSQTRRRTIESMRQANGPSASFSLPLKINAPDQPSARSVRRASQALDQADVASPVPVVHTLTAKVDLTTRTTISNAHIPPRRSSNAGSFGVDPMLMASQNANPRLSLFPSQPPPYLPSFAGDRIKRSPSTSALYSQNPALAASTALKRPTSMQVRSSTAPFLSTARNSGRALPIAPMRPGTTVPIRSLKPSRNSVIMQSPGFVASQDPFYEAKLASVALAAEAGEDGMSLPLQHPSPPMPIMQSAPVISSRRTSRIKSGTLLELGMPLAALGPPAPPPQAPLPEIPTASKPNSPVDNASPISKKFTRKDSPPQPGLGIQITKT